MKGEVLEEEQIADVGKVGAIEVEDAVEVVVKVVIYKVVNDKVVVDKVYVDEVVVEAVLVVVVLYVVLVVVRKRSISRRV